nr:MAG TPA: AAA domain protein [Caudoviricetes sp.]
MFLEINKIGKFKSAKIEINGITVIAGPNNTGKSTIGKFLFALFNSFYDIKLKAKNEKFIFCNEAIKNFIIENMQPIDDYNKFLTLSLHNKFINIEELENLNQKDFIKKISEILARYSNANVDTNAFNIFWNKIENVKNTTIEEYANIILKRTIDSEFNGQLINIKHKTANAKLTLSGIEYSFKFDQYNSYVERVFAGKTDVTYIDNPYIIDNGYDRTISFVDWSNNGIIEISNHQRNLQNKFYKKYNENNNPYAIIFQNNKLRKIFDMLTEITQGAFTQYHEKLAFLESRGGKPIYLPNLSTGLKTFVILKRLIENMVIKEKDLVILDEPEIHLHPEWQLTLAEIIVLLQIELNLHVLINTHSPYFLNAIEVFTNKYDNKNRTKYYLSDVDKNESYAKLEDVTNDVEQIYYLLAKPMQELNTMTFEEERK